MFKISDFYMYKDPCCKATGELAYWILEKYVLILLSLVLALLFHLESFFLLKSPNLLFLLMLFHTYMLLPLKLVLMTFVYQMSQKVCRFSLNQRCELNLFSSSFEFLNTDTPFWYCCFNWMGCCNELRRIVRFSFFQIYRIQILK